MTKHFFYRTKYVLIALFWMVLMGSVFATSLSDQPFAIRTDYPIQDLTAIPQADLLKSLSIATTDINRRADTKQTYFTQFFKAWTNSDIDSPNLTERAAYYSNTGKFDETLKPYSKQRLDEIIDNANITDYHRINQFGIIAQNTDLRSLPTLAPRFDNPQKDRGAYPFDNSQDDLLYIGTPVRISHLSKDKAFTYVQIPPYSEGWVRTQHVVTVSPAEAETWRKREVATFKKENIPLVTTNENFIDMAKLGTHLPILQQGDNKLQLLVPYKTPENTLQTVVVSVPADCCVIDSPPFTKENIEPIVQALIHKPYGWGTLLGNRDCSSLTRDFYRVFHIWMPRFSRHQYESFSNRIDLRGRTAKEKFALITAKGIPFRTLLYKTGHIGIYAGIYQNEPIMFHSVWGNKTRRNNVDGWNIIGQSVFTTLQYGRELKWLNGTFLDQVEGMAIINQ